MLHGALYIRVSTEEQTEFSPDAQKRLLLEYAQKNNILVKDEHIFVDEGISGRKAEKRPGFMKMIATAKKKPKPFDVILIHRFDRFSRSREDSIVYKSLLKKECDIKVISITEQLEDDKFSIILEAMLEAMAEYYSLNLADEVTKGMTEKALRGGFQANPPLGYKVMHTGETPVIVPEEAAIVKLIFHKYVYENMTVYEIAKYLNLLGYQTKRNKPFERRSIEYILKNPFYKGYVRWNRTHGATKTVKDSSKWIIVKGRHQPVITEELYELTQKKLESKNIGRETLKSRPTTEYKHWLSGIVKCGFCGKTMTASKSRNSKYIRFSCSGYSKGKCPVCNSISERKLIPGILMVLEKELKTDNIIYVKKNSPKRENYLPEEKDLLNRRLAVLKEKESRIRQAYITGIDTLEEYKENKACLIKEQQLLKEMLTNYEKQNQEANNCSAVSIKGIYDIITSDAFDNRIKNQVLKTVIEKIVYNKKERQVDIYFKNLTLSQ